jgi:UDPglucose--hexose-1-phosphate uridylyltransferase
VSQLRFDPLQERWVIIPSGRARTPSDYIVDREVVRLAFSPFSEGNEARTPPEVYAIRPDGGEPNTPGWSVRVVPNKFPMLGIEGSTEIHSEGASEWMDGVGIHEVVVESPDVSKDLADLEPAQVSDVFLACRARVLDLRRDRRLRYLLVFKNHGVEAGSTISHSHTQIIGLPITPIALRQELAASRKHFKSEGTCLFCHHLASEVASGDRVVTMNDHFVAYAPYASRVPFELNISPREHAHSFADIPDAHLPALGEIVRDTLGRLRRVLKDPPYNFALHTAPNTDAEPRPDDYWATLEQDFHWHLEIVPRLIQVTGLEWGAGVYVNSMPPEDAAAFLRDAT